MSLSICIPTFNRETTLLQTLKSLVHQLDPSLDKIVISDNASTDNTFNLVESLMKEFPFVTYFRWPKTVEVGQNLLKSVELSSTDYCWLLTDDDVLEEGAIQKVKNVLEKYPGCSGVSVDVKGYDCKLKSQVKIRFTHSMKSSTYFENSEDCLKHLGAWIGYWSAQIVRKDLWLKAIEDSEHEKYLGYHHLYLLAKIIKENSSWYFLSEKCVGYRSNNESFKKEYGDIKRYEIDAVTYLDIYSKFFHKKSPVTQKICRDVINYYLFWQLVSLKCSSLSLKSQVMLLFISIKNFYSYTLLWLKLIPLIITPRVVLLVARFFYRRRKIQETNTS